MVPKNRLSLEVRQAILRHLRDRMDAKTVSVASIKKSVHTAVPRCTMTEADLTNLIAETVIDAGFGVEFDDKLH